MQAEEVQNLAEEPAAEPDGDRLEEIADELARVRKAVLRQGHAQELFQARVEAALERLAPGAGAPRAATEPSSAQLRALVELDQALLQLLRLAEGENRPGPELPEDAPRSLREGLSLLQLRVRNLQHAMGLEAIPALGRPFDDRRHEACGVAHHPDLPEGWVTEELLPGYRLGERVVRPARVIVNRRDGDS